MQSISKNATKPEAELHFSQAEMQAICKSAKFVGKPEASRNISALNFPSITVTGSCMASGARMLYNLKSYAPDARNHIVSPGFQVSGTRGAKLLAGDRKKQIHGQYVEVNAQISQIDGFSGHADGDELMRWLSQFRNPPKQTFVIHGEHDAADTQGLRALDRPGWAGSAVEHMQSVLA